MRKKREEWSVAALALAVVLWALANAGVCQAWGAERTAAGAETGVDIDARSGAETGVETGARSGAETGVETGAAAVVGEQDWESLDFFLQQETEHMGSHVTFSQLVRELMDGNGRAAGKLLLEALQNVLFREIADGGRMAGQLLALGMIGAIFAGFSEIFAGGQISETGFFLTYLMAFTVMAAAFSDSIRITADVLGKQIDFMKVLMPSYFLAVAWAGAGAASAAWYEVILFLIASIQWLYRNLLIPLVRVYLLLSMAGHMAKENMLSRMTDLLKTGIAWATRSLIGIVIGFQLIQGMVLPYADAVKTAGIQKVLQIIPGIGQGVDAAARMVLGSGVLIKNTMGAAAVLILVLLSLIPVIKLAVLLVLYRMAAAVIQPVGDKRLVACISSVADGQKLLLGMVLSGLVLFVIAIALICSGTNAAYFA